jgi:hypothetical protein
LLAQRLFTKDRPSGYRSRKKSAETDELAGLTVPEVRGLVGDCPALTCAFARAALGLVDVSQEKAAVGPSKPLSTTCAAATLSSLLSCTFITTVVVLLLAA